MSPVMIERTGAAHLPPKLDSTFVCTVSVVAALSGRQIDEVAETFESVERSGVMTVDEILELFDAAGMTDVDVRTYFHDELDALALEALNPLKRGQTIVVAYDLDDGSRETLILAVNDRNQLIGFDYRSSPPTEVCLPREESIDRCYVFFDGCSGDDLRPFRFPHPRDRDDQA